MTTYWNCSFWPTSIANGAESPQSNQQPGETTCYLLACPRELSDIILEYSLVSGYHEGEVWIDAPDQDLPYSPPPLLSTCRQIRNDAREIYFKKTKFLFEDIDGCKRWLESLDSTTRGYIRHLGYCTRLQEDDADLHGDRSATECLAEIEGFFAAAGLSVKKALRVCNGCSYRFRHQWVGWNAESI